MVMHLCSVNCICICSHSPWIEVGSKSVGWKIGRLVGSKSVSNCTDTVQELVKIFTGPFLGC